MDPTRSAPIPELIHPLPEWTRPHPTRYRGLYIIFRCGTDHTRAHAGACTSSTGMNPIISGPVPELKHHFQSGTDPIRSDTGAYTSPFRMGSILYHQIPELIPILPEWIRPDPIRYRSLYILFRNGPDLIRPDTGAYTLFHCM
jgi:hypothetical protein